LDLRGLTGLELLTVVLRFELCRRHPFPCSVKPAVVPPVHPGQSRQLHLLGRPPRPLSADQLGLVESVDRLGERIIEGVALRSDRGDGAGLGEALGVATTP
jgi:hypothetical protein